jgi:hypothetical protein
VEQSPKTDPHIQKIDPVANRCQTSPLMAALVLTMTAGPVSQQGLSPQAAQERRS